jgi:hypothetical protein
MITTVANMAFKSTAVLQVAQGMYVTVHAVSLLLLPAHKLLSRCLSLYLAFSLCLHLCVLFADTDRELPECRNKESVTTSP